MPRPLELEWLGVRMAFWCRFLAAMVLSALLSTPAIAGVVIACLVSYQDSDGFFSDYQTATVSFMTGFELREATDSLRYDWDDIYALVQIGEDDVAVVNLDTAFALAGPAELNPASVRAIFADEPVLSGSQEAVSEKRRWRIKARREDGVWIDPRVR